MENEGFTSRENGQTPENNRENMDEYGIMMDNDG